MFDPTKPVQTRDGRPARIICTDANARYPIVALITNSSDEECLYSYFNTGQLLPNTTMEGDLINVPVKHTGWMNLYQRYGGMIPDYVCMNTGVFKTKELAQRNRHDGCIACVKIEFTEGDGL